MKILITTGIFPPDIGGPAQYAKHLTEEFLKQGHKVRVMSYNIEKKLPTGIRHFFYFLKIIPAICRADFIIVLDTFSVGLPSLLAAKIFRKKIIFRIGGDFSWENYVETTGNLITLRDFYKIRPHLSFKQKIIFKTTLFVLKNASASVFSTEWQRDIWQGAYDLNPQKLFIIENFYGEKIADYGFQEKNFLWAGRPNKLKNLGNLKVAFSEARRENSGIKLEISGKVSHGELMQKIQGCYAVILPSLSDISPNFILEAVRANKPFILTEETGFYEKLKDVGIFIAPLDKDDIKKKILFLANDGNYQEYKKRIKSFVFTHSWRQIADEFLNIFERL